MDKSSVTLSVGSLIGNQVRDGNGASLGRIEELMIDPRTGHVDSVVLSMGNAPDFGNAACAIPWEALRLEQKGILAEETRAESEAESETDKHAPASAFSVYTFSVSRHL